MPLLPKNSRQFRRQLQKLHNDSTKKKNEKKDENNTQSEGKRLPKYKIFQRKHNLNVTIVENHDINKQDRTIEIQTSSPNDDDENNDNNKTVSTIELQDSFQTNNNSNNNQSPALMESNSPGSTKKHDAVSKNQNTNSHTTTKQTKNRNKKCGIIQWINNRRRKDWNDADSTESLTPHEYYDEAKNALLYDNKGVPEYITFTRIDL